MVEDQPISKYKIPISVLVVVYTRSLDVLLLERADRPGFWQSITGSMEQGEQLIDTALREVREESGIRAESWQLSDWKASNEFEIFKHWRGRYAPGVTHNLEHVFSLQLEDRVPVKISVREHSRFGWFSIEESIEKVFSWTNADALKKLAESKGSI